MDYLSLDNVIRDRDESADEALERHKRLYERGEISLAQLEWRVECVLRDDVPERDGG